MAMRRPVRAEFDGHGPGWAGSEPVEADGVWVIVDADDQLVATFGGDEDSQADAEALVAAYNGPEDA